MKAKFYEFKNEKQLEDFCDFSADLHDGRITEMKCKVYYEKDSGEIYSLKIKIEGVYFAEPKYLPESIIAGKDCKYEGVELLFDDIGKMFFSPAGRDYFMSIFDALLKFKDGKILFNAFGREEGLTDLGPANLYVEANKLRYRLF